MNTEIVSEEEMRALLPAYEVGDDYLDRIRNKILIRTLIIVALLMARMILIMLFPEYHITTFFQEGAIGGSLQVDRVMLVRVSILILFVVIYVVSCWKNFYFRTMNVLALIITCSILWSDAELHMMALLSEPTLLVLSTLALRLAALVLLTLNYIDVRR